jgi:hypothetical protein
MHWMIIASSFFQSGASVENQLFGRVSGNAQCKPFVAVGAGPLGLARVVAEAWIEAQVGVWVGLFHRIKSKETRIVLSFDSNLLADRAADGLQQLSSVPTHSSDPPAQAADGVLEPVRRIQWA